MKKTYAVFIGIAAILLIACRQQEKDTPLATEPIKVKTMQITSAVSESAHFFSGTVEETSETPLSFPVMGTIKTVNIHLGSSVTKGQLLATLDETSMKSSYEAAKATLMQAQDAYQRLKQLHDKGSLAEIKWIEVQSKLQQAQAMEELARKNLNDCRLYAPFSGVISEKSIEVGQNIMPGITIGKIVGKGRLKVKISVPESEISQIVLQQEAQIQVPALSGKTFTGKVIEKGVVANPLSRSYEVKIEVAETDNSLLPGMVTEVFLEQLSNPSLVVIPAQVVQIDEQNRTFVWLNQNGKAAKRFVTIGAYTAEGISIASGLSTGDEIIIEGQQKVCENTEVSL